MNKHLLDIPLETPEGDLPHYAKRWTPEGFRKRMERRKADKVKQRSRRIGMRQRRKAPWPDYAGNPIREGDTIRHPEDGMTGVVFVLEEESNTTDRWKVLYGDFEPARASRLCLQIGDKGQAVVVQPNA